MSNVKPQLATELNIKTFSPIHIAFNPSYCNVLLIVLKMLWLLIPPVIFISFYIFIFAFNNGKTIIEVVQVVILAAINEEIKSIS